MILFLNLLVLMIDKHWIRLNNYITKFKVFKEPCEASFLYMNFENLKILHIYNKEEFYRKKKKLCL